MRDEISERIGMLLRAVDRSIAERRLEDALAASEAIAHLCGGLASLAWPTTLESGSSNDEERSW